MVGGLTPAMNCQPAPDRTARKLQQCQRYSTSWLVCIIRFSALLLRGLPALRGQSRAAQVPEMHVRSQPLEITFCGLQPEKPPLKKLFFNITLRNWSEQARWFLSPNALYPKPPASSNGGVDAVEVYSAVRPAGHGRPSHCRQYSGAGLDSRPSERPKGRCYARSVADRAFEACGQTE